jgi:hypothetical protein
VTDSTTPANQDSNTFSLHIASSLKITKAAFVKGVVDADYAESIGFTGGVSPFQWSVLSGTMPPGLSLDVRNNGSKALVTGKPTQAGKYVVTFQVQDNETTPATDTKTFTINIVPTVQIAAIEFTQAIQEYQVLDELMGSLQTNGEPPVPIVSRNPAVMRVYFTKLKDSTDVKLSATGAISQDQTMNLPPDCRPEAARANLIGCRSMDFYFTPPSGSWSTVLTLEDNQGNQLEQETLNVTSRDTASVLYKAVGVCTVPGQPTSCQDPSVLLGMMWFANRILPSNLVDPPIIVRRKEYLDPNQYTTNGKVSWDNWGEAVNQKIIADLYSAADTSSDAQNNQYTDYVGIYNGAVNDLGIAGDIGSHVLLTPSKSITLGIDDTAQTLAHETGHTLNLPHTGVDGPRGTTLGSCFGLAKVFPGDPNQWIYNDNHLDSSLNGTEVGFDVPAQNVLPGEQYFELMSYCEPYWISPYNYKNMFPFLNAGTVNSANVVNRGRINGSEASINSEARSAIATPKSQAAFAQGSFWRISGSIPSTGVVLNPIFTEAMIGQTDAGTGTYSIQIQGGSGQALYTRNFTPAAALVEAHDGSPNLQGIPAFSQSIPVTAGAAAIAIVDPSGTPLTKMALTGTAPIVTITSPAVGFVGSGIQTISWTAQSSAAALASRIFFSKDNGASWEAILDTDQTSAVLDFNTLPGTSSALIRVDVSDGVNTGSATSSAFNVPQKLPTSIVINNPVSGSIFQAVHPVYLAGLAYDPDDGVLTGTALKWSDSIQGALGTGSRLSANLQPGVHTITLTATDSDGNALTAKTHITMAGAAPVVTLTINSGSGCTTATINAVPGNLGVSLTRAAYSFDGGNSYSSVALNKLPFTVPITASGTANVVALAVDASGQVSSKSQPVNAGSGCPATPQVKTGSGQTALVGSAFTTALSTLVLDGIGNPVSGVVVTYAVPSSGASATLSATSATTDATGVASITATANNTAGAYNVTATTTNGASPATFSLTNSDFQIAAAMSTLSISRGSSGTDAVTLTAISGFNGTVTFACSGLPSGATCAFSPGTVTPTGATASTTLTVAASQTAALRWPAGEPLLGGETSAALTCVALLLIFRRRNYALQVAIVLAVFATLTLTGCGSASSPSQPPPPPVPTTATITVTGSSGTAERTTTITLQIQ